MKLETTIKPRKDGSVKVAVPSGGSYAFTPDKDGCLTCEVQDDADIAFLLDTGNFHPADEADHQEAIDIADAKETVGAVGLAKKRRR